jgi:hypothetical protein
MIFRQKFLDGIRAGVVTVAFRRWRRPSVKGGGTLLTAVGQLDITSVSRVALDRISTADARRAGYDTREALLADLNARTEGEVYRIELGSIRADPRIVLRESPPEDHTALAELTRRLHRLDARAGGSPWTQRVLEVLRTHPGVRAGDLCKMVGQEKQPFKINVRKLKTLGLTESLEIGYRLSPRGAALLESLRSQARDVLPGILPR